MFQILMGIALLGLITIPVLILILSLYQNLLESIRPKPRKKPTKTKSYYTDSDERLQPKLKIVK